MSSYQITAHSEKGNVWAQFEINTSIGTQKTLTYNSIEDAKEAPLIQQLFYLPFVKSVRLSEKTLEVERFDILEWEDVLEEVRLQLENYLNEGGIVLTGQVKDKIPVSIYAESTPNPAVMKFVANKFLVTTTCEFKTLESAAQAPLAKELFSFPFVKEVFIDANYVSISKTDALEWDVVVQELREFIRSFLEAGNDVVTAVETQLSGAAVKEEKERNYNETEKEIVAILDEYIKPAVASDGGNIVFDSYDAHEKTVKVILQGACSGCPSSTFTLKSGIENMLREMMPEKVALVEAING